MGLLSFRKKSSDDESKTEEQPVAESTDVIGSNLSNDDWLAGVERRDASVETTPQPHDAAYDYPVAEEAAAAPVTAAEQFDAAAEHLTEVQQHAVQAPALQTPTPETHSLQVPTQTPAFPDMGIVYAGLETEGVAAFPSEAPASVPSTVTPQAFVSAAPPAPPAPPAFAEANPAIRSAADPAENGPVGSEAEAPLRTLGLTPGCSWDDVASTRLAILEAVPNTGAPEEQEARAEVNHAAATLRLLRVGPLKG